MPLRIVTYDLNKEANSKTDYDGLYKIIKAGGDGSWKRLNEHQSYA